MAVSGFKNLTGSVIFQLATYRTMVVAEVVIRFMMAIGYSFFRYMMEDGEDKAVIKRERRCDDSNLAVVFEAWRAERQLTERGGPTLGDM